MTDIDSMTGRELDEQVAIALGWTREKIPLNEVMRNDYYARTLIDAWRDQYRKPHEQPLTISTDTGAAFGLLVAHGDIGIDIENDRIEVYSGRHKEPLATGAKSDAAAVMVRAWLKVRQRSVDS